MILDSVTPNIPLWLNLCSGTSHLVIAPWLSCHTIVILLLSSSFSLISFTIIFRCSFLLDLLNSWVTLRPKPSSALFHVPTISFILKVDFASSTAFRVFLFPSFFYVGISSPYAIIIWLCQSEKFFFFALAALTSPVNSENTLLKGFLVSLATSSTTEWSASGSVPL